MSPFAKGASPPKRNAEAVQTALDAAAARIRELEAGLLVCRQARSELEWECGRLAQLANEATARAEKAEARAQDAEETCILFAEEESKLRARVAELERQLDEARSPSMHEFGDECYEFVAENPPEREAD